MSTDLANLIGSLKHRHYPVVTKIPEDYEEVQYRGLELLSLQITRPDLAVVIEALQSLQSLRALHNGTGGNEMTRNQLQKRVAQWCADAFGIDHASNIEQRGLRLAEEAIEAAQSAGCDPATLHKLIDYIYAKPPGFLQQELGGVGLCVLAMANAAGFNADDEEIAEVSRVLSKPLSFFADRNKIKNEAGFIAGYCQPVSTPSGTGE